MGKLFLVRHGAYERLGWSRRDEYLTETGIAQVRQAAALLLSKEVTGDWQLLSSQAPRAVESANIIGNALNVQPVVSDRVWRAGDSPSMITGNLVDFAADALREKGAEYDFNRPLAIVSHLPLLACAAGDPRMSIENGAVLEYDPDVWRHPAC
ncbi:MAG TPA: phosphoglycerate mutase family protein [Candidatus Saccharimonadales bacterium]|nr:phosphoglycerate mutase family protein [Candidatus Saccharimonadales bacterium]